MIILRLKPLQILKKSTGASMVFVLAVMLLLIAVGASALAAASVSAGTGANRQTLNQLRMYTDSMHKAIHRSLLSAGNDADKYITESFVSLGGQILRAAYYEAKDGPVSELALDITPYFEGGEPDLTDIITSVTISVTATGESGAGELVVITPFEEAAVSKIDDGAGGFTLEYDGMAVFADGDGRICITGTEGDTFVVDDEGNFFMIDEEGNLFMTDEDGNVIGELISKPRTASISGIVEVRVETRMVRTEITIISAATYGFSGGYLENIYDDSDNFMKMNSTGDWGFVSYETYGDEA